MFQFLVGVFLGSSESCSPSPSLITLEVPPLYKGRISHKGMRGVVETLNHETIGRKRIDFASLYFLSPLAPSCNGGERGNHGRSRTSHVNFERPKYNFWKFVTCMAVLLTLGGCGASTQPPKFYLLNSLSASEQAVAQASLGLAIAVGPIKIPEYVDRPQIVTRISENELKLAEFHKWAEPLKDNIPQVLADNLSLLMRTDQVNIYPWKRSTPIDYQVTIDITRFDTSSDAEAHLVARWQVFGHDTRKVLALKKSHLKAPLQSSDYHSIVSALNQTLADLSRAIATSIGQVHKKLEKP